MATLFHDPSSLPYSFFLIPPLNANTGLCQSIESHGGLVSDQMFNSIVLGIPDTELLPDVKHAHVYSYKVIEDSIKEGIQMEFGDYLIHLPESEPNVTVEDHQQVVNEPDITDPQDLLDYDRLLSSVAAVENEVIPTTSNLRYFEPQEDRALREEVRKRPWYGIKGHTIYNEISKLPFFQQRFRTGDSLRERMRTLNYEVGYVYKEDPNKKGSLLLDSHGNFIRTASIKSKSRKYTPDEDMIFCKTLYQQLNFVEDERGFESVEIPTSFYDKYAQVYPTHTKESYRQRFKNFLIPFGIKNYIKYYMVCKAQGNEPKATNQANLEWLKARKQFKKWKNDKVYKLYYPDIPTEDEWIEQHWYLAEVEGEVDVIFENTLSRGLKLKNMKRNTTVQPQKKQQQEPETDSEQQQQPQLPQQQKSEKDSSKSSQLIPTSSENLQLVPLQPAEHQLKTLSAAEVEAYLNAVLEEPEEEELDDADLERQIHEILQRDAEFTKDTANNKRKRNIDESEDWVAKRQHLDFNDEPTTKLPPVYQRLARELPINLPILDKKKFFSNLEMVSPELTVKEYCVQLERLGVQQYFTLFLLERCGNNRNDVVKCIRHYVETEGKELLFLKKGIWSNKSIEWLELGGEKAAAVEAWHGEESASWVLRELEKKRTVWEIMGKVT
ncbi:hypothetical protein DAMA08_026680 [Martiniozyma asiatica (nom. inval.)]|nr:hypothetical protein DAMA08_026680 [Martiniozyma asiatica]